MASIAISLFGLAFLVAGLYYSLGKLEPNNVRWIATGSICLSPVLAVVSLALGQYLYKTKVSGLRDGIETARDAWHEVSVGVGKVTQARQRPPVTTLMPYPYPVSPPSSTGMIVEQRSVDDEAYWQ
jgi:hypothetical protein